MTNKDGKLVLKGLKAGATVFLLFLMAFLCTHFKEYQKNSNDQVNKYRVDQVCLLAEGTTVKQSFLAKHTHLKTVKLYFSNDYGTKARGNLVFSIIKKENGERVSCISVKIKDLLNNEYTEFNTDLQLEQEKEYVIQLKTYGTESGKEPIVYQWRTRETGIKEKLSVDDTEQNKYLVCKFYYPVTIYKHWAAICGIIIVVIALLWFPLPIAERMKSKLTILMLLAAPFFTFWFAERFTDNSISRIHPTLVALNLLVYFIFYGLLYLVFVSKRLSVTIGMVFWYLVGIANYFVLSFKGAPIVPSDMMSVSTAASVAENYTYTIQPVFVWNGLLILLYLSVFYRVNVQIKTGWKIRTGLLVVLLAASGILGGFVVQQKALKSIGVKNNVWDQKKGYAKNGLFFGFVLNMNSLVQEKPTGYSVEAANEIAGKLEDKYEDSAVKKTGALRTKNGKKPNMIFIMNEAFSDLSVINEIETNQDYMPFIHDLKKDTIKGNLYMSIFGSGTCNSEFEFLTGNSMSALQNGIIAYTQILKGKVPNVTYLLKEQGYAGNVAMHPYLASGWNRPNVYQWMGFEKFYSEEDFQNPLMYRKYISDQSNMDKIIELYESREDKKKPFYLFNVTMQNHGGFDKTYDNFTNDIQITDAHKNEQAEQYLSLIKKTDDSFKQLVTYFQSVKEPTIIVMFGDHQPAVESAFYDSMFGSGAGGISAEEMMKKYQTPFIIWANYDIKEGTIDKMSANYLSAYVMREAGLRTSDYQKYLLELYEKLPVITAVGCYDQDGNYYKSVDKTPYKEEIQQYQILQYNNLIDLKYTVESCFYLHKGN